MPGKDNKSRGGAGRLPLLWLPLIAAAVAASLLAGCGAQSPEQEPRQSAEKGSGPSESGSSGGGQSGSRDKLGNPILGDADAPVVMVEYGDFQ